MKRRIVYILTAMVLSQCLMACGSSSKDTYENAMPEAAEDEMLYESDDMVTSTESAEGGTESQEVKAEDNRKLIRNVYLRVETKEYDDLIMNLEQKVNEMHGYIENLSSYNDSYDCEYQSRNSSYTIRIPAKSLDAFVNAVGEKVNVLEHTENVDDVTLNYVDMDSHVRMLKEEQERLMSFLEQAETIEEIVSIEQRLSEVKYQIESMSSQLKTIDNQVDYATVKIDINEVAVLTPVKKLTAGERMAAGFMESIENIGEGLSEFGIWFVIHIPYLVVWAVLALIVLGIIFLCNKISKKYSKGPKNQADMKANPSATYARPVQKAAVQKKTNGEKDEK